ncbi:MAG: helix-turn-helix domain-containing protein [Bacteroidota bacterium]
MSKHRGKVVEKVVLGGPYPIKKLADKLQISRNTLYQKFKKQDLSYDFILEVGSLIHHDFTQEFKELSPTLFIDRATHARKLGILQAKHVYLAARYDQLLRFLVHIAQKYPLSNGIAADIREMRTASEIGSSARS